MKLTLPQLLNAIKCQKYKKFLIFGPDEGAVHSSQQLVIAALQTVMNEVDLAHLQYSQIKGDIGLLVDNLQARSLFGGQKLVVVHGAGGNIVKTFLELYSGAMHHGIIVTIAGDLGKTSALRRLSEELPDVASIACYKLDERAISVIIKHKLDELQMICRDPSVIEQMVQLLPSDPLIIGCELEKLALYKGESLKEINSKDVSNCFSYSGSASLDDLVSAIISKDPVEKERQLFRLNVSDISFMLVVRALQNFFGKLLQVQLQMSSSNLSSKDAVMALRPPIFFKSRDNMMLAARSFSLKQTHGIIGRLLELERRCKGGSVENKLLLQHFLLLAIR